MSDYEYEIDDDDEQPIASLLVRYAGPDDSGGATSAAQSLTFDTAESMDADLPKFLLRFREMLRYVGFSEGVVDDLLDKQRIESHLPHEVVSESMVPTDDVDAFLDKYSQIEESNRTGKPFEVQDMIQTMHDIQFEHVEIYRKGLDDFTFEYSKGGQKLTLPKSFFDDLFESSMELNIELPEDFDGEEEREDQ